MKVRLKFLNFIASISSLHFKYIIKQPKVTTWEKKAKRSTFGGVEISTKIICLVESNYLQVRGQPVPKIQAKPGIPTIAETFI